MIKEIHLPEISENVESGDVTEVMVQVGDVVKADQTLMEMDTDKANVEVPSPYAGKITEVHVESGAEIKVGQVIMRIEVEGEASKEPDQTEEADKEEKSEPATTAPEPERKSKPVPNPEQKEEKHIDRIHEPQLAPPSDKPAPAAPSVRRLAREIGIDINQVPGSGAGGRINQQDVKDFARKVVTDAKETSDLHMPQMELPDFSKWGEVTREPMSKIRQITADGLSYSWVSIPHVTQIDKADITELDQFRQKNKSVAEAQGAKLTTTAILVKVIVEALKRFPKFNASIDIKAKEIIYKKYYHVGIAVDTDRGLLVPVIRDADQKSITEIAIELNDLAERTRSRKIAPDEMQGGTFTISNLGGIGGTAFTPIVYPPQVAIIGVSRASMVPKYDEGDWIPRLVLPLMLSYDHRLIDGADGARFLRWVAEALEHPIGLLM